MSSDDALRFPIGKHKSKESYRADEISLCIDRIEALPIKVETLVKTLPPKQLQLPYRDGGWTALQVIHHIPDSHLNAYVRIKLMLTEDVPTIKPYNEGAWSTTPENALDPVISINLLKAIHVKWVALLRAIPAADYSRQYFHPESKKHVRLDQAIAMYAWHGEHHLGHLNLVATK
ncbi:YfiT family bacillithiol transferase [Pseudochryseolinea flava]|uniref:Putative metal-dependent hydrolase n=1 Tax=Pseudochryseolinea flava TaxID=2059302 RepID=A0A364XW89_9BACT|nr:putative metal-dependent hydrolase [Pseudochryseolinea flava]RAV98598.1 putative metal-dependent hydrolase [Pseudochryseolinea flava]